MAELHNLVTPVGRLVEGDPWVLNEKDAQGQLRVVKTGPNAGKPNAQFYVGIAVAKYVQNAQGQWIENPDWAAFYGDLMRLAIMFWPNLFPNGGACIRQDFAFKVRDGDGFSREGKPLKDKPGFAGHWVVSLASSFAPQIVAQLTQGTYTELTDPKTVQRGYYVRVGCSVASNKSTQTPGLYLNLNFVELMGKGEVINTGQSAAQVLGAAPAPTYMPAGMQALTAADLQGAPGAHLATGLPQGGAPAPGAGAPPHGYSAPPVTGFPTGGSAPGFQGGAPAGLGGGAPMGQAGATGSPPAGAYPSSGPAGNPAGVAGAPAGYPNAAPGAGVGPAPVGAPVGASGATTAPVGAAPSAPAPAYSGFMGGAPVMLPAANGVPYEQFIAQGWTEAAMIQEGFMAAR